jgi:hypothetical protein
MNRYISRYAFIAILAFGLASCESYLEWPANVVPRLTIISHVSPGNWEVDNIYVYSSKSPLDSSQFYSPYNIRVKVTEIESETSLILDSIREGNKVHFDIPTGFLKAGHSYSIEASAPGFEPVHAATKIPEPSTITDLTIKDVEIEASTKNEFKNIVRYTVEFNIDHQDYNKYYHLVFYNRYADSDGLFPIDPEFSDDQPFIRHYAYGVLINRDDLPNGALSFNFVDWVVEDGELKTVYVELRSISEEYYKYHSSLARQVIIRQDPFAEPITIFNNIDGGYGNFSGFSPAISFSNLP